MRIGRLRKVAGGDPKPDAPAKAADPGAATGGPLVSGPARVVVAGKRGTAAGSRPVSVSRDRLRRDTAAFVLIGAAAILLVSGGAPLFGTPQGQVLDATGFPSAPGDTANADSAVPAGSVGASPSGSIARSASPRVVASTAPPPATPQPSPTPATATPRATASPDRTPKPSPTATPKPTSRPSPSRTPRPTQTPSPTPTETPTPTPAPTVEPTPTPTPVTSASLPSLLP
jgi:hypothetical protein